MIFSSKTLLAILAIASATTTSALSSNSGCELEYVLFNADTDEAVGLLQDSFCIPDYEVNIQARPTAGCSTIESALMSLTGGPITARRTENAKPYMIFGDRNGNIFGHDLKPGTYTIDSDLYSKDWRRGDLVVSREFTFEAKYCKKGYVEVINKAPEFGTCQTPVWVGIHGGTFDTYDRNAPLPAFMEALVEDGNNGPITDAFESAPGSIWDGTVGEGPICAGETAYIPFEIELVPDTVHYFSYASMILPSNDAFVSNGNPQAFPVFDADGNFIDVTVESLGSNALDGGTEVNDEIPQNTAFFGQTSPNTGTTEHGVVESHPGFLPVGSVHRSSPLILESTSFVNADFTAPGYQFMEINVHLGEPRAADVVPGCDVEFILFDADADVPLRPLEEVECVESFEFNIQARPTAECPTILSADMALAGPINEYKLENFGPYMIFGDNRQEGDFFGRDYKEGSYTISAALYSERHLRGDLVVEGELLFEIESCNRRRRALRGNQ